MIYNNTYPFKITLLGLFSFLSNSGICEPLELKLYEDINTEIIVPIETDNTDVETQTTALEERYTFDELVNMASSNHPSISVSKSELKASKKEVEYARHQFYPSPSAYFGRSGGETTTTLALEQPLWTGGRLTSTLDSAKTRVMSREANIDVTRYDLTTRLINLYQLWVGAHGRIAVQKSDITRLEKYLDTILVRFETGVSAEADMKLVMSRLTQSRSSLDAHLGAERRALAQLSQVVGRPLYSENLYEMRASDIKPLSFDITEIVNNIYSGHPVLRQINADIEAAEHDQKRQKSELFPVISLRGEQIFGGVRGDDQQVFLTVNYAPGAGLSVFSRISISAAETESLRRNRDVMRRELMEQVYGVYENYLAAKEQLDGLQDSLAATQAVLESYTRMFNVGRRNWLDVMNLARELTQVELSITNVTAQLLASRYLLDLLNNSLLTE